MTVACLRTLLVIAVLAIGLWGKKLYGVTTVGHCPDIFVGEVTSVVDIQTPYSLPRSGLSKVTVTFQIDTVIKDAHHILNKESVEIKVLKNGPYTFSVGDMYEVGLNNKWLCSSKKAD